MIQMAYLHDVLHGGLTDFFSVEGQIVSDLGSVYHMVSVATPQLCRWGATAW